MITITEYPDRLWLAQAPALTYLEDRWYQPITPQRCLAYDRVLGRYYTTTAVWLSMSHGGYHGTGYAQIHDVRPVVLGETPRLAVDVDNDLVINMVLDFVFSTIQIVPEIRVPGGVQKTILINDEVVFTYNSVGTIYGFRIDRDWGEKLCGMYNTAFYALTKKHIRV